MVSWPSYLYNGNSYTRKDCFYIETGPRLWVYLTYDRLDRVPGGVEGRGVRRHGGSQRAGGWAAWCTRQRGAQSVMHQEQSLFPLVLLMGIQRLIVIQRLELLPQLTMPTDTCQPQAHRDHFVYGPSQWETMLHCNMVPHCLTHIQNDPWTHIPLINQG